MKRTEPIAMAIALLFTLPVYATDARTEAMGGVAIASGHYLVAPVHNPALLAEFEDKEDFGLLLPALAVEASDPDDVDDRLDEFQREYEALIDSSSLADAREHQHNMADLLAKLDGKVVQSRSGVALVAAIPNQYLPLAFFASASATFQGVVEVAQSDIDDPPTDLDNIASRAIMVGAATVDVGVTVAQRYDGVITRDSTLSFGYSPKFQQLHLYHYRKNPVLADFDDASDSRYRNHETEFNLDIGLLNRWDHWALGLSGTNLFSQTADTIALEGVQYTYKLRPQYGAGLAYIHDVVTVALDADLNRHSGFTHLEKSQFVRIGTEINGWDWAQLRLGFRKDMEDLRPDLITGGIGLSPFNTVHLDLALGYGGNREYSAALQLAMTL